MRVKMGGLTEAFTTLLTRIRFLSCVDPLMSTEPSTPTEFFPTLLTFKRFLSSVNDLVDLKI